MKLIIETARGAGCPLARGLAVYHQPFGLTTPPSQFYDTPDHPLPL